MIIVVLIIAMETIWVVGGLMTLILVADHVDHHQIHRDRTSKNKMLFVFEGDSSHEANAEAE